MTCGDIRDAHVCIASRNLANSTGVATYSAAVSAALATQNVRTLTLRTNVGKDGHLGRARRWLTAWSAGARPLKISTDSESLIGNDLYRIAQVHFDLYGRPMRLAPPYRTGIVHWTYPVPLFIEGWSNVYTIHDVIPLLHPELTPIDPRRHRRLLNAIAKKAQLLITVSDAAREEIINELGQPRPKVLNLSAASGLKPIAGITRGDHLLVCGSIESRKNIVRIVAAYRRSRTTLPLVIVGPDGWRSEDIRCEIGNVTGVSWLPYLDREPLMRLIASARALLMPSLAEGFGLPVLEAMALGTPVLTSNRGALAEISGGAALLVDPYDVNAIADGIHRISVDEALLLDLARVGLRRARSFSLDRFGQGLADAYGRCIASPDVPT